VVNSENGDGADIWHHAKRALHNKSRPVAETDMIVSTLKSTQDAALPPFFGVQKIRKRNALREPAPVPWSMGFLSDLPPTIAHPEDPLAVHAAALSQV
jgi:hypothetical protein